MLFSEVTKIRQTHDFDLAWKRVVQSINEDYSYIPDVPSGKIASLRAQKRYLSQEKLRLLIFR